MQAPPLGAPVYSPICPLSIAQPGDFARRTPALFSFSALAALLAALFTADVGRRWLRSRRPAFAAWAAGLAIFAAAAAVQAAGEARGFGPGLFRAFYLLGGILGVAYLGLGTVLLLAPARWGRVAAATLLGLTLLAAVVVALAPVDAGRLHTSAGVLGDALSGRPAVPTRALAVVLNIAGTIALVGGSAWSALRFVRTRAGLDRVLCNVLLTAGALVVAAGLSAGRLAPDAAGGLSTLGAYEAVGIALMFAGFLTLGRVGARRPPRPA